MLGISEATAAKKGNARGAASTLTLDNEALEMTRSTIVTRLGGFGVSRNIRGKVRIKFGIMVHNRNGRCLYDFLVGC